MGRTKCEGGIGLMGIRDFNTILLRKHYWILLNDENSFIGKVLKGRCYPRSSLVDATIGFNPI